MQNRLLPDARVGVKNKEGFLGSGVSPGGVKGPSLTPGFPNQGSSPKRKSSQLLAVKSSGDCG